VSQPDEVSDHLKSLAIAMSLHELLALCTSDQGSHAELKCALALIKMVKQASLFDDVHRCIVVSLGLPALGGSFQDCYKAKTLVLCFQTIVLKQECNKSTTAVSTKQGA